MHGAHPPDGEWLGPAGCSRHAAMGDHHGPHPP
jgi:hypothetical protein